MLTADVGGLAWTHRPCLEETRIDRVGTIHDLSLDREMVSLGVKTAKARYQLYRS